jgi:FkbM family methyltransferase
VLGLSVMRVEPGIFCGFKAISSIVDIRSFWDVGANIGYYSWLVKSLKPGCALRLFEPEPENIVLIRQTIERANLLATTVRQVAVSDHHDQKFFIRDQISGLTGSVSDNGDTFSQRQWGLNGRSISVPTVSLDEERSEADIVDLIKIDVEGHEEAVFRGASATIAKDQPIIIFECFHGAHEINEALRNQGYFIADAETMNNLSSLTTNFIALPRQHLNCASELTRAWRAAMTNLGLAVL